MTKDREALIDAALERLKSMKDWTIDNCTCEDPSGFCWFRLTDEQQERYVLGSIVDEILENVRS